MEYAAAGWAPWASQTSIGKLEAAQRYACRAITGLVKTTPNDILLIESDLQPMQTRLDQISTIAYDKALRLPNSNPRTAASKNNVRHRTNRNSWRNKAQNNWKKAFDNHSGNIEQFPPPEEPWVEIKNTAFSKVAERKSASKTENNAIAKEAISQLMPNHDIIAYTDGSAQGGTTNGGAGVFFQKPAGRNNIRVAAGKYTSSFQAEMTALQACLNAVKEEENKAVLIITDSLSAWQRIKALTQGKLSTNNNEQQLKKHLQSCQSNNTNVHILWSPSHCDIEGNDMADQLANEGSQYDQGTAQWTHETAKARIKSTTKERKLYRDEHTIYIKQDGSTRLPNNGGTNRADQVLASRVRSNHHPDTLYWRHKIGLADTNLCRLCSMAPESAHHIVTECPATTNILNRQIDTLFDHHAIRKIWDTWNKKISQLTAI